MVPLNEFVLFALIAFVAATNVHQCPGFKALDASTLSENVQLEPCKKPPCLLKKGTNQHITIAFTPEKDIKNIKNHVTAEVFGLPVPFVGVDGNSVCDKLQSESGEKTACPLKAGTKYVYKDSFPVLSFYPNLRTKVHWALQQDEKDLVCFEVPVRIQ